MKLIRVGAAALNQTPLDWDHNFENIKSAIELARSKGVSLLCLPELSITGYGCEDAFFSPAVHDIALEILKEIIPFTGGMVVAIGLPLIKNGALFNTSALVVDGQLAGFAAKQRLAGDGLHYEPRWFKAWPANMVSSIKIDDKQYPIGDLLFDVDGIRIGFEICEDAWVAERPASDHAKLAADIILNPSASHFAFGKAEVRERLVTEASRAFGVSYVYSNLVGNEAGRVIYDGQTLISTDGEIISRGQRLSFQPLNVISSVIDIDVTRMRKAQSSSYIPDLVHDENRVVNVNFKIPPASPETDQPGADQWEGSKNLQEEEFTRAIALGLFDYLRKSHSKGFVVSLSGGADSAAVSCLVANMVKLAVSELGHRRFCEVTGLSPLEVPAEECIQEITRKLLTTVYQATKNSSDMTRQAARTLAEAIHSNHYELDVEEIVTSYTSKLENVLNRELTWEKDDLTLQNIQARVRGPGVWMFANIKNALLLATSNRSEAAVGYATMDGDTCGGISLIAGIDKAFLLKWMDWLEKTGPSGIGPINELKVVNQLQPTAELRPLSAGQIDEDDLMPYDVLDAIEDHAIGKKRSPKEVLEAMSAEFGQYPHKQLMFWVHRFFRLWSRNQWKRERYAPSFHVDDKNLDPKTWCRFPILSGGFQRELESLDSHYQEGGEN